MLSRLRSPERFPGTGPILELLAAARRDVGTCVSTARAPGLFGSLCAPGPHREANLSPEPKSRPRHDSRRLGVPLSGLWSAVGESLTGRVPGTLGSSPSSRPSCSPCSSSWSGQAPGRSPQATEDASPNTQSCECRGRGGGESAGGEPCEAETGWELGLGALSTGRGVGPQANSWLSPPPPPSRVPGLAWVPRSQRHLQPPAPAHVGPEAGGRLGALSVIRPGLGGAWDPKLCGREASGPALWGVLCSRRVSQPAREIDPQPRLAGPRPTGTGCQRCGCFSQGQNEFPGMQRYFRGTHDLPGAWCGRKRLESGVCLDSHAPCTSFYFCGSQNPSGPLPGQVPGPDLNLQRPLWDCLNL